MVKTGTKKTINCENHVCHYEKSQGGNSRPVILVKTCCVVKRRPEFDADLSQSDAL